VARTFLINPFPYLPVPPLKIKAQEREDGTLCRKTCFRLRPSPDGKKYLVISTAVFLLLAVAIVVKAFLGEGNPLIFACFAAGAASSFAGLWFFKEPYSFALPLVYLLAVGIFNYTPSCAFSALTGVGGGFFAYWGWLYYSSPVYSLELESGETPKGYWLVEVEE
jgi:hypothetical protein